MCAAFSKTAGRHCFFSVFVQWPSLGAFFALWLVTTGCGYEVSYLENIKKNSRVATGLPFSNCPRQNDQSRTKKIQMRK